MRAQQHRKMWHQDRYCKCPNPLCDHCYPYCLNESGGICLECMAHDEKWDRISHEPALGGLAADQAATSSTDDNVAVAANAGSSDSADDSEDGSARVASSTGSGGGATLPPYADQANHEFSIRIAPAQERPGVIVAQHMFISVVAAEERVSKAVRQARVADGEPELHTTRFWMWIEERPPRAEPQKGNDARVRETQERLQSLAANSQARKAFGAVVASRLAEHEAALKDLNEKADERGVMDALGLSGNKPAATASSQSS